MGNKLPYTPKSRIVGILRTLFLRSRERNQALKNMDMRCCLCNRRQSAAKVLNPETQVRRLEVHHLDGIEWDEIVGFIREKLLCNPDRLAPLCPECHAEEDTHRHLKKPTDTA